METCLEVNNLSVAYEKMPVLWGINLQIPKGRITSIIGPNGSGKSTFLKACLGLVPSQTGNVRFQNSKALKDLTGKIAYLPQRESIDWNFPITALEVSLMGTYKGISPLKKASKQDKLRAFESLELVKLEEFADTQISDLSGGQQQRVFLARALSQDADYFFLDEPFAAVDVFTEKLIIDVLKKLRNSGKSIFMVHHDLFSVAQMTDEIIVLNTRLIKYGSPEEIFQPEIIEQAYGAQLDTFSHLLDLAKKER